MQEEMILKLCEYSHDYDGAVTQEQSCRCHLYRKGEGFFVKRRYVEKWDSDVIRDYTEDIPVQPEDLDRGIKKFCRMYCHGREDNEWIDTYQIHRDADEPDQITVRQMMAE